MTPGQLRFAGFVATLGRGPGRSRALTRDEAREAMRLLLAGEADPVQVGAFLMLLRYRGEDPAEIAGLVDGARESVGWAELGPALDWPSYGAGRTRARPWFLLAALALGRAGTPVFMHGSNEFASGETVAEALAGLGMAPAMTADEARRGLASVGFAYAPLAALSPALDGLLRLRGLLGLRSPLNTVARLLDPADAAASVDGVFHPPYIAVHLGAASLLGRQRLLVLKGGGGEAERNPARPVTVHLLQRGEARAMELPALGVAGEAGDVPLAAVWSGAARDAAAEARIVGTIGLGLLALGRDPAGAEAIWVSRHGAARLGSPGMEAG